MQKTDTSHSSSLLQRGFTLIEIMVVVVIMGILAALVVPKLIGRTDDARVTAARQDIATIMQGLKLYKLDNQRYGARLAIADDEADEWPGGKWLEDWRLSR